MPKRKKQSHDFSIIAHRVVEQATAEPEAQPELAKGISKPPDEKNPNAVALGRLGGKKGGPARAAKLTAEQRQRIAQKAAQVRWRRQT